MAIQQSQVIPAQFVQDLGQDLAKQVTTKKNYTWNDFKTWKTVSYTHLTLPTKRIV